MITEELMRFDWVCLEDDNTPRQVDWIRSGEVGLFWNKIVTPPYLEPIPLTAEILEKNGFKELMSEGWESAAKFGRIPEPTGVWQYGFGQFDSVSYVPERSFLRVKFMEGYTADIVNIKYVHELQRALRLLKINKDIEL